jgi:hypothetical protein
MRERINFWLAILGVVAYLSQPIMIAHEHHKSQPILSHVIFEN